MRCARLSRAVALAVLLTFGARADMLYWWFEDADVRADVGPYEIGTVVAVKGDARVEVAALEKSTSGSYAAIDLTDYGADWSFMVEVYNYGILNKEPEAGDQLYLAGGSERYTLQQLIDQQYVLAGGTAFPDLAKSWHPTVYLPEPSSGLLTLLGFSFLALRRKRRASTAG